MSRRLFAVLLAGLAVQRLFELRLSRQNTAQILAQGGREHAAGQVKWMTMLHVTWFAAVLAEVFGLRRPFVPRLALGAGLLLAAGQALRYAAIRTLGPRWSVQVVTLPGAPRVQHGIYRWLRHPNYLGVALEIAAVPLLHSAYLSAAGYSLLNGLFLARRIRSEEHALAAARGRAQPG